MASWQSRAGGGAPAWTTCQGRRARRRRKRREARRRRALRRTRGSCGAQTAAQRPAVRRRCSAAAPARAPWGLGRCQRRFAAPAAAAARRQPQQPRRVCARLLQRTAARAGTHRVRAQHSAGVAAGSERGINIALRERARAGRSVASDSDGVRSSNSGASSEYLATENALSQLCPRKSPESAAARPARAAQQARLLPPLASVRAVQPRVRSAGCAPAQSCTADTQQRPAQS